MKGGETNKSRLIKTIGSQSVRIRLQGLGDNHYVIIKTNKSRLIKTIGSQSVRIRLQGQGNNHYVVIKMGLLSSLQSILAPNKGCHLPI